MKCRIQVIWIFWIFSSSHRRIQMVRLDSSGRIESVFERMIPSFDRELHPLCYEEVRQPVRILLLRIVVCWSRCSRIWTPILDMHPALVSLIRSSLRLIPVRIENSDSELSVRTEYGSLLSYLEEGCWQMLCNGFTFRKTDFSPSFEITLVSYECNRNLMAIWLLCFERIDEFDSCVEWWAVTDVKDDDHSIHPLQDSPDLILVL